VAILKVAQLGHPVLRAVAEPVDPRIIPTPPVQQLVRDMLETMDAYDGAGLAAPQVHVSSRLVVLSVDEEREPEAWFNPEITPLTDQTAAIFEGCLSVTGLRGRVARPALIHVRFLDVTGAPRAYLLAGFPAIVAQHECDHLDGVLYVDRVDPRTLAFLEEFRKFGPLGDGGGADDDEDDEGEDEGLGDAVITVDPSLSPTDALRAAQAALEA
jgi:peptide deformylase